MELMLASKFVETEVKEFLNKFEMTQNDRKILIALAEQIIKSYEDYRKLTGNDYGRRNLLTDMNV